MKQPILQALLAARAAKQPAVLLTDLATGAQRLQIDQPDSPRDIGDLPLSAGLETAVQAQIRRDRTGVVEADGRRLFVQLFLPPLRLAVVGAVHIAQALVPMASLAGYDVTVIDPRRAFASDDRFPDVTMSGEWPDEALEALRPDRRTAVVTLTHDPKLDDPALDVALRSPAFYIAALGSRRTHGARLERLTALGHDATGLARIHGPAGIDIGAVSPAEIAVSVLAEMTAALRKGSAG